jgi:deoxyadenosine/deoxycytidine kinase
MRLEICGGIASGKTTLAKLLAKQAVKPVYEKFRDNPFWKAFYTQPGQHIFETEFTFALQHYHELKIAAASERTPAVADFSLVLDAAYADIGLSGERRRLFEALQREILQEIGPPRILVHLECSSSVELSRIRGRSRREEASIDTSFLTSLNRAIKTRVDQAATSSKVLRLNSADINFATNRHSRQEVLDVVTSAMQSVGWKITNGKHYRRPHR